MIPAVLTLVLLFTYWAVKSVYQWFATEFGKIERIHEPHREIYFPDTLLSFLFKWLFIILIMVGVTARTAAMYYKVERDLHFVMKRNEYFNTIYYTGYGLYDGESLAITILTESPLKILQNDKRRTDRSSKEGQP